MHSISIACNTCAAWVAVNAFITSWTYRTDTFSGPVMPGQSEETLIGYLAANCSDGSALVAATRQTAPYAVNGQWIKGEMMTDTTETISGYSSFELTYGPRSALCWVSSSWSDEAQ